MASSAIKPGILVALQELDSSSPLFKHGSSLRVTGKLQEYCVETAIAVIIDGNISLKIDTQHLRDISFHAILQARVGRNVDGIDLNLYHQSLQLRRWFEANHLSARKT
ncbi:telomere-capping, CST complex subunit isoform X2 [Tasmannia lanceolata]|uniref:telomere-capping, CST complex subunit isoform X2 n=1 Tax=Tasmannia lanceolata TaxID=3420 RepID=UPI004062FD03